MSEDGGVRGVVVAHAGLAAALIEAVDRIIGLEEGVLVGISNDGMAPPQIRDRITELVGDAPAVVFTDLREGSCGLAARQACTRRPDQVLVTGANLPMLLDFALNRHRPLEEVLERVLDRGVTAIQRLPEPG